MSLVLENITKGFDKKIIFDNFSYSFKDTGLYIIIGESGIGKTTFLRIISGLDKKYKGKVINGGFENCSFAFQEYRLFPELTAYENVALASFKTDECIDKPLINSTLKRLGFNDEDIHLLPRELSGGMKQRVSIARAILKKSNILILDEPTKELDASLRETVVKIIAEESQRRLVLVVSHNIEELHDLNGEVIKF